MGVLKKFVNDNSDYVKVKPNEIKEMIIEDYSPSLTQDGKPCIVYKVSLPDVNGYKNFTSASLKLADQIACLPNEGKGCTVTIERIGEGFNTKYEVVLVAAPEDVVKELEEIDLGEEPENPYENE